ncbi:bifunctional protein-disulfide isomerase/oxidoreductase DsbC [Pseudoalteromonas sp. Cnat2-41]|uniref:bifunctional protein-disulfide isomerase/oxidoreductase DsbC n=1 Tax=unclassified Pseudoalteromonas TaxID=194690 RepID=UPI001EF8CBBE|nr:MULTISPECIES: bifunctional protein-disulfide isomerase/oxidoreductase DsbC [unclassified Pseudoalteromonas]MCF2863292.1 bifunctional protein-disulfide isomerase/oxidoreductase DsbC [Pseudoalteromonas sp. CNAT2-18]MCG7558245.1 bifunctional protein-disulfide isomerase/oxidoreductase DsbC [Pseudoalteromonas sp. CNAT2-18.1]
MKKLVVALAFAGASTGAFAQGVSVEPQDTMQQQVSVIQSKLAELGVNVKQVHPSPVQGLQEVITDKGVFYASADGRYLVQGTMIDLVNRENLTERALSHVRLEGVAQYQNSMITYKADNEKGKITVFTDITCGYCRKLHRELDDYLDAGITVQYLAFPRGGLRGSGYTDLMNVWCADNKQEALTEAKAGEKPEKIENCNAPVAEHYQLGQSFGISGTPAIILSDGSMIPGYQPAAAISSAIDELNNNKS